MLDGGPTQMLPCPPTRRPLLARLQSLAQLPQMSGKETVRHYLMVCLRLTTLRLKMREALAELRLPFNLRTILSQPKAIPITAAFIAQSRRFPLAREPDFDDILPTEWTDG